MTSNCQCRTTYLHSVMLCYVCITFFDVKDLFTTVPVDSVISIIKHKVHRTHLHHRTSMSTHHIIILLEFCLKNTYFLFQGKYYDHVCGGVLGSPSVLFWPTCSWKSLKLRPIKNALHLPRLWLRYVDDTFVIQNADYNHQFLQHISSIGPHIQFTAETPKSDGSIPFLYIYFHMDLTTLLTNVKVIPTHTDQYLHWDNHHNPSSKFSVLNNHTDRARTVYAHPQLLHKEEEIHKGGITKMQVS